MKKNYTKTQAVVLNPKHFYNHLVLKQLCLVVAFSITLNAQAQFTEQTGTNNPFDGFDIGTDSTPAFVDLDNDNDLDLVSGNNNGTYQYFLNNGSNIFTELTGANNPFDGIDSGSNTVPTFADIDSDGDLDFIIGKTTGTFNYFQNDGNNNFIGQGAASSPFTGFDVGGLSSPELVDLDNDGDLDLVSGANDGTFHYYSNNGSNVFTEQLGINNPFDGFDVLSTSRPKLIDLDGDGDLDLVSGNVEGLFNYYENNGTNVFTEQLGANNPLNGIDVGFTSSPAFADLDSDGDMDLISGSSDGTFRYYINDGSLSTESFNLDDSPLSIFPNPVTTTLNIELQPALKQLAIYNLQGQKIMQSVSTTTDVSNLSNGLYLIKIEDENGSVSTKRFVKN
ncbi:T9SS type A sorting domain-containing protein [Winogradskyella flava]|uniref:T9SS type A sorting domain-containing protein n=1 Tax=Winogradskyella flava TaxID=1884876 RepID=A0A842IU62_9FLAO|nr:T9SS type A sorting domain-containing protein [Winogradskyella flava]MBC2845424.1 T9SS type A sorting domain-containing protein [Winogradskyella flava]